jgi:hypothetical protein
VTSKQIVLYSRIGYFLLTSYQIHSVKFKPLQFNYQLLCGPLLDSNFARSLIRWFNKLNAWYPYTFLCRCSSILTYFHGIQFPFNVKESRDTIARLSCQSEHLLAYQSVHICIKLIRKSIYGQKMSDMHPMIEFVAVGFNYRILVALRDWWGAYSCSRSVIYLAAVY